MNVLPAWLTAPVRELRVMLSMPILHHPIFGRLPLPSPCVVAVRYEPSVHGFASVAIRMDNDAPGSQQWGLLECLPWAETVTEYSRFEAQTLGDAVRLAVKNDRRLQYNTAAKGTLFDGPQS